jgi:hypothetical protein
MREIVARGDFRVEEARTRIENSKSEHRKPRSEIRKSWRTATKSEANEIGFEQFTKAATKTSTKVHRTQQSSLLGSAFGDIFLH